MLEQLSEVMLGWSKFYIVEIMNYTLACMMMLEDFPEGKGRLDDVYTPTSPKVTCPPPCTV